MYALSARALKIKFTLLALERTFLRLRARSFPKKIWKKRQNQLFFITKAEEQIRQLFVI